MPAALEGRTFKLDPRGIRTTYSYNANDELLGQAYPNGRRDTFTYDDAGNRTSLADSSGTYLTTYDSRNESLTVTNPDGKRVTYQYDAVRRRQVMADPDGGLFTYTHTVDSPLARLANPQGQRTTFTFDAAGRLLRKQLGNSGCVSYTYDCANQLLHLANWRTADGLSNLFTYTYNAAGMRTGVVDLGGDRTTWTYDSTHQLVNEHRSGDVSFRVTYAYDPAGNRLTQVDSGVVTTYTYNEANEPHIENGPGGKTTYTYDECGNRTAKDAPSETTYYTWEAEPPGGCRASGRRHHAGVQCRRTPGAQEVPSTARPPSASTTSKNSCSRPTGQTIRSASASFTVEEDGDLLSQHDSTDSLFQDPEKFLAAHNKQTQGDEEEATDLGQLGREARGQIKAAGRSCCRYWSRK